MNDCQPGRFCPNHPVDPGLLVLIAVALIAFTLVAVTVIALLALVDATARRIRHRLTRTRRDTAAAGAALAGVRALHRKATHGDTCVQCAPLQRLGYDTTWPCDTIRALDPPATDPASPQPHLDVMAAAVEDWWLTTDPVQDRDTGAEVAAHVEMYLHGSGYRITPWPHTPGPSRARTRLRTRAR